LCCVGERQSWAAPSVPNVNIVNNSDLLKSKPYGTFKPQVTDTAVDSQQAKLQSGHYDVDDQSSRPSSEEQTAKNVTDKNADNSKVPKSQTSDPDASSDS